MINKKYFFAELKRMCSSPVNWLLFIVCTILFFAPIYEFTRGFDIEHMKVTLHSIELITISLAWTELRIILPLVVCLPCAMSCAIERRYGYSNIVVLKMTKRSMMSTKLMVNFIVSGVVVAVPYIIACIFVFCICGTDFPIKYVETGAIGFYEDVAYEQPVFYSIMMAFNTFVCCGVLSTVGMGMSNVFKNTIIAYVAPWCIYLFSGMVITLNFEELDIFYHFILPDRRSQSLVSLIGVYVGYFVVGVLLYYLGERYIVNNDEKI